MLLSLISKDDVGGGGGGSGMRHDDICIRHLDLGKMPRKFPVNELRRQQQQQQQGARLVPAAVRLMTRTYRVVSPFLFPLSPFAEC
jgi:hypothetical protein